MEDRPSHHLPSSTAKVSANAESTSPLEIERCATSACRRRELTQPKKPSHRQHRSTQIPTERRPEPNVSKVVAS